MSGLTLFGLWPRLVGAVAALGLLSCASTPPPAASEPEPTPETPPAPVVPIVEDDPALAPPLYDEDAPDDEEDEDLFSWKRPEEDAPSAPVGEGELPQICEDYLAMMGQCMKSQQLPPEAQRAMEEALRNARESFRSIADADAVEQLNEVCRQALDALSQSQVCGAAPP